MGDEFIHPPEDMIRVIPVVEPDDDGDIPADQCLELAVGRLSEVAIVGRTKDGSYYFASNLGSRPQINWLLDQFKQVLLEG